MTTSHARYKRELCKIREEEEERKKDLDQQRFHFGGDEVPGSAWLGSDACHSLLASKGEISLKQYFLSRVVKIMRTLDLDMAAWEDGFKDWQNTNLPPQMLSEQNVYTYSWKNPPHMQMLKSAYTMANMGYKVVLASATNLYLDHAQEPDPAERGLVWATRFVNTKRSFSYSPLQLYRSTNVDLRGKRVVPCENDTYFCPSLMNPESIEGMEAILFGELITSTKILDYMLLPRLLAVAERAWHEAPWEELPVGQKRKMELNQDWTKFANTLGHRELPRLDNLGYQYRIPPPGAIQDPENSRQMLVNVTYPGHSVEISRNGGWGWARMLNSATRIEPGEKILLRSKAGTRYSRAIVFNSKRQLLLND
ncbi:beta-hexosaminidase [Plakobranchus ocellatus]|uniref:beta-N-acetylhexosaminidase n=1 Tax=Plakobranchus ocellatus TaxID=259542 RepID=A0AAV4B4I9_9GAST|nr:beta-hexosaminidase [Plakobranchus ocellatus]